MKMLINHNYYGNDLGLEVGGNTELPYCYCMISNTGNVYHMMTGFHFNIL